MAKSKNPIKLADYQATVAEAPLQKPVRPLIFISHDHRDAQLAEAFANLLTDASGGFIKSFRSSDRKGTAGIEFGAEWYSEIMGNISEATDVVALLTANSIDRPWILYEAGVAKGKLDKPVFGIVVGVPFDQATKGPFAQFQNSGDDQDSLTKLVLQLIKRNSDAEPRYEAVKLQVQAFSESIRKLTPSKPSRPPESADADANSVAKLFEEIKVMFRDLPEKVQGQLSESLGPRIRRRSRRFHPMMMMDMMHHAAIEYPEDRGLGWLLVISNFKDDAPWLYEVGLDVYRALQGNDNARIAKAINQFDHTLAAVRRGPMAKMVMDGPEMEMAVHELAPMARHLFLSNERRPIRARATSAAEGTIKES